VVEAVDAGDARRDGRASEKAKEKLEMSASAAARKSRSSPMFPRPQRATLAGMKARCRGPKLCGFPRFGRGCGERRSAAMQGSADSPELKPFLVELRPPAIGWYDIQSIGARSRAICSQLREGGTPVRFLRSLFVPEDDTCFLLYRAESAKAVAEAARRIALPLGRLLATVDDVPPRRTDDYS
jgi:hypothetical protein